MRKSYDLKSMKWTKNPYVKKLKKSVTIRIDDDVLEYFKGLSEKAGMPYQTLLNHFLRSCKEGEFKPKLKWSRL